MYFQETGLTFGLVPITFMKNKQIGIHTEKEVFIKIFYKFIDSHLNTVSGIHPSTFNNVRFVEKD